VWKEVGRGKSRFLADERCSQAVLDFLSTRDVGRLVPAEGDVERGVGMGAEGAEGTGRREKGRGGGAGRRRGTTAVPTHALLHGICRRGLGGRVTFPFGSFLCLFPMPLSFVSFLCLISSPV